MSDAQLARRAARGDRRALAGIFERHHQALYRYCHSLLGNDADAQDALQNTMVRVVRALPGEQREISVKAWLYRIAYNESVRILGARRPHAPLDEAPELAAPDETAGAEARERLATLVADLQQLPERARSALVMRELNGASFQEIGETFGISPAAAKQAVYEARVALQDFEAGRAMNCDDVTRAVSDGDGRRLRQRKLRAHLRACDDCRAFQAALERRGADLRALAPPLAPAVAAGVLADVLGGGSGGTAAGAGIAATATTKAGGAAAVAAAKMTTAAVAVKGAAVAAVTVAAGAGVLHATAASEPPPREPVVARTASAQQAATGAQSTAVAGDSRPETSRQPTRGAEKHRQRTEEHRRKRAATGSRDIQAIGAAPGPRAPQRGSGINAPRRVAAPPAAQDKRDVPITAPAPKPRARPTVPRPAPGPDVGIDAPVPTAAPAPPAPAPPDPAPPDPAPAATPDAPDVTDGATGATKKFPE